MGMIRFFFVFFFLQFTNNILNLRTYFFFGSLCNMAECLFFFLFPSWRPDRKTLVRVEAVSRVDGNGRDQWNPPAFFVSSLSPLFRLPSLFVLCQCTCAVCAFAFRLPHTQRDFLSSFFFFFFFLLLLSSSSIFSFWEGFWFNHLYSIHTYSSRIFSLLLLF